MLQWYVQNVCRENSLLFFLNSHVNVMNIKENIEYLPEYKKKICDFSKNKN